MLVLQKLGDVGGGVPERDELPPVLAAEWIIEGAAAIRLPASGK
jgi:hypothetical protein